MCCIARLMHAHAVLATPIPLHKSALGGTNEAGRRGRPMTPHNAVHDGCGVSDVAHTVRWASGFCGEASHMCCEVSERHNCVGD